MYTSEGDEELSLNKYFENAENRKLKVKQENKNIYKEYLIYQFISFCVVLREVFHFAEMKEKEIGPVSKNYECSIASLCLNKI